MNKSENGLHGGNLRTRKLSHQERNCWCNHNHHHPGECLFASWDGTTIDRCHVPAANYTHWCLEHLPLELMEDQNG